MATNLKRRAYEHIRLNLFNGNLPPGTILSPVVLAREIGVSHTPVREAISQLESEGLIEQLPRLGPRVKVIDRRELEELFDLREMLESGAAAKAAERITAGEIAELRNLCEQFRERMCQLQNSAADHADAAVLAGQLLILDVGFHIKLLNASNNRRIRKIVGDLHIMTNLFRFRRHAGDAFASNLTHVEWAYQDHCKIVDALERRDSAEAARCAALHARRSKQHQFEILDKMPWHTSGAAAESAWPDHILNLISEMEEGSRPVSAAEVSRPSTKPGRKARASEKASR
jgi:DNA-binding GntR family transcriptional regulator